MPSSEPVDNGSALNSNATRFGAPFRLPPLSDAAFVSGSIVH
jgi:hypothetical protein